MMQHQHLVAQYLEDMTHSTEISLKTTDGLKLLQNIYENKNEMMLNSKFKLFFKNKIKEIYCIHFLVSVHG